MSVAEVVDVGPDIRDKYTVGDKVYVGKLSGLKMVELGDSYFLVNHQEVLAKVKADATDNSEAPDASGSVTISVDDLKKQW
jgi:hypothetical protein